ncbi:MBL fold metallo-hydrolase, partial [Hungatella sp. SL.1.14]|uniref:MBL fold metallo-hydrolase n=1 Tax=Hungatella sp. SL.1.14 TaxID=2963703 RepID=UPI00210A8A7E
DEKTVLFDTVDRAITGQFLENVESVLAGRTLDYVIVNHMEPDHCATLGELIRRYPDISEVCNAKTIPIIKQFYEFDIDTRAVIVKENDTFCSGRHTFTF